MSRQLGQDDFITHRFAIVKYQKKEEKKNVHPALAPVPKTNKEINSNVQLLFDLFSNLSDVCMPSSKPYISKLRRDP